MSKKFTLKKPPVFRKNLSLPIQSISELSTLRTKHSKCQQQRNLISDHFQLLIPTPKDNSNTILCQVLSNGKYSHRPVSIVSLWCQESEWLRILLQQLTLEYNGWLENDHQPHFSVVEGQYADTFILLQELKYQQKKANDKLVFQYGICDTIFLLLKQDDASVQNKILQLCQTLGDTILLDKSIQCAKPSLILCRVFQSSSAQSEVKSATWHSFITKIVSWRHFSYIEILDVPYSQLKNHLQQIKQTTSGQAQHLDCCAHIKQIIRKKGKPQEILGEITTGKMMVSIMKQLYFSLNTNCYSNLLNILKDVIHEEKEIFQAEYSVQFNKLIDTKISDPLSLKRYGLFKCALDCRKEAAKLFNNFRVTGRYKTAKIIEQQELEFIRAQIQFRRQKNNSQLYEMLQNKYLNLRPVSMTKCKRMIKQLSKQYNNDGTFEDLKQFLLGITRKYGDELLWGDELNGINIMDARVDQIKNQTLQDIKQNEDKLRKLQNKEYLRHDEFTKKTEMARNIRKAHSNNPVSENSYQALLIQKITGQIHRINDLKRVVYQLEITQHLMDDISVLEKQHQQRQFQIQQLKSKLQRINQQEQVKYKKRNKIEKQKQILQQKRKSSIKQQEKQKDQNNIQKEKEKEKENQMKKRKGVWGCFGC